MERVMASHTNKSFERSLDTDRVTTSIYIHSKNKMRERTETHSPTQLYIHKRRLEALPEDEGGGEGGGEGEGCEGGGEGDGGGGDGGGGINGGGEGGGGEGDGGAGDGGGGAGGGGEGAALLAARHSLIPRERRAGSCPPRRRWIFIDFSNPSFAIFPRRFSRLGFLIWPLSNPFGPCNNLVYAEKTREGFCGRASAYPKRASAYPRSACGGTESPFNHTIATGYV